MDEIRNFSAESLQYVKENNSKTPSTHEFCDQKSVIPKEAKIVIYVVVIVVAMLGNSLLIAAYNRMKETIMLFIANMAASDLLTAIVQPPRFITMAVTASAAWQVQGLVGTISCKICSFLGDMSLSVSTQSLVIIAVERFLAILHPFQARLITMRTRRVLIAFTWIVAIASHAPHFFTFDLQYGENIAICRNMWELYNLSAFLRYSIFLYVIVLALPLIAIIIIYPITVFYLRRDKMAEHRSCRGEKRFRQSSIKLFKLATATVLSFVICWLPFSVITLLRFFSKETLPKCSYVFETIIDISLVLATSYCAVNPFICFIFLGNFRSELRSICRRRKRSAYTASERNRTRSMRSSSATTYCPNEPLQLSSYTQFPSNSAQTYLTPAPLP